MTNEERRRAMDQSVQDLARLVEKNEKTFGHSALKLTGFEDAVQCLNHLLAKSKRQLEGFDSDS